MKKFGYTMKDAAVMADSADSYQPVTMGVIRSGSALFSHSPILRLVQYASTFDKNNLGMACLG